MPTRRDCQTILDCISAGVFTVDKDWRIRYFNPEAERITGVSVSEALGRRCCEVLKANICESDCALRWTLESGKPLINKVVYIVNTLGEEVPISITTALLKDDQGNVVGGVETFRDLSEVEQQLMEFRARYAVSGIITRSEAMRPILDVLPSVSEIDCTVLLQGESGTGKELIAKAIHNLSPRKNGPLVIINSAALPDTLLESELFGYKAGAFTGARKDKIGRFAKADGGTLFLDEIGDISAALQVRLLRVLQEKTIEPVGATESVPVDVRVVVATNKDLGRLVEEGGFRRDLYYRINVVKLKMPPLRERPEDIPLLIDHFISHFNRLHGKAVEGLTARALQLIMKHDFPGNVRELENAIEHAFVYSRGGMISPEHLPEAIAPRDENKSIQTKSFQSIEANFLLEALRQNNWNRKQTAAALGIHTTTLWRKLQKHGIAPPT
jgi:PAS domain S-box-containing protein